MKTITLKTDDTFFEHVSEFAKSLNLTKSELIRRAIAEYELHMQIKSPQTNVAHEFSTLEAKRRVEEALQDYHTTPQKFSSLNNDFWDDTEERLKKRHS